MIYLDNAATTALHESVLSECFRISVPTSAIRGSVHAGRTALHAVMNARAQRLRNASVAPRQIVFTSGGTEADNQALAQGLNLAAGAIECAWLPRPSSILQCSGRLIIGRPRAL